MALEVIRRCERHPDREAEEVEIALPEGRAAVDLCSECREPLVELLEIGRKISSGGGGSTERGMANRIRGVPPLDPPR